MNKDKPYVICHMLGSVDGRIKQDIWGFENASQYFEETAEKIETDAWLVGRVTMQEFSSKRSYDITSTGEDIPKKTLWAIQKPRVLP